MKRLISSALLLFMLSSTAMAWERKDTYQNAGQLRYTPTPRNPDSLARSAYGGGVTTVDLNLGNLTNNLGAGFVAATRDANWPNEPGYLVASDYGTPSQATLTAADTVAAAAGKQLIITPGAWTVSSDLTLVAAVKVMPGALLTRAGGNHLTINNAFECGLTQCFNDSSTNHDWVRFGDGTVKEVYPEWWGAIVGDATDCHAAFAAALNTGVPVRCVYGSYKIVGNLILSEGGIIGSGWGTNVGAQNTILKFYNCTDPAIGAITNRLATSKGNFARLENLRIIASSWDATTGCLGYGLDIESPVICKNVYVHGFKKSNIWLHQEAAGGGGPYQSLFENVSSHWSGQHGCLVGYGANCLTFINYQGKWNGAPSYGVVPSVAGDYDGFLVDATADGGSYTAYNPETLTIIGGDCSYNSRYGWYFKTVGSSNTLNPGYAEGNLVGSGYQAAVGHGISTSTVNFGNLVPSEIQVVSPYGANANSLQIWASGQPVNYYIDYSLKQRAAMMLADDGACNQVISSPTNAAGKAYFGVLGKGQMQLGSGSYGGIDLGVNYVGTPKARYEAIDTPVNITGASDNGSGAIRLAVAADFVTTGQRVFIRGVQGVPNANSFYFATRIDASHIDLVGSTFSGTYVSGGEIRRVKLITHASSYPTSDTWAIGDIISNTAPTASGIVAWVCTTGGAAPATAKFAPIALGAAVP